MNGSLHAILLLRHLKRHTAPHASGCCLDVDLVHHSGEGDALAAVLFAGDPGDGSLDAEGMKRVFATFGARASRDRD